MNSEKQVPKDSIKDIYSESKHRIRLILAMLGKYEPEKINPLPDEKSFATISNLINSIMSAAQFESENQYRNAIVEISNWMNCAFNQEYLTKNEKLYPNPLFAVRKGGEILHSFLHRDLRRKQFSSEEDEIYRNFLKLISSLPDPRNQKLDQGDVDGMIDDLLKTS
ncbi:hypothetical protein ACWNT8_03995 [Pigmentibacter ruber]|uniref:hypothetical protein n=1 Tax=Pigmentibacter ruber TaxID=2683196 RepID=UPI00131B7BBF|nr:hypothetical protein [Pigmentibacter ruber]BFD30502.1 hypothetical protein GTC16762_01200 [Pigmentibacter ruber]